MIVQSAVEALVGLDVLVCSAGIWRAASIAEMTATQLEEMFRINLFSLFYLVRESVRYLGEGSSIVFVGSTAGQRGEAGHSHYAATKGGVQTLCFSLAEELAPRTRVNVVPRLDSDAVDGDGPDPRPRTPDYRERPLATRWGPRGRGECRGVPRERDSTSPGKSSASRAGRLSPCHDAVKRIRPAHTVARRPDGILSVMQGSSSVDRPALRALVELHDTEGVAFGVLTRRKVANAGDGRLRHNNSAARRRDLLDVVVYRGHVDGVHSTPRRLALVHSAVDPGRILVPVPYSLRLRRIDLESRIGVLDTHHHVVRRRDH